MHHDLRCCLSSVLIWALLAIWQDRARRPDVGWEQLDGLDPWLWRRPAVHFAYTDIFCLVASRADDSPANRMPSIISALDVHSSRVCLWCLAVRPTAVVSGRQFRQRDLECLPSVSIYHTSHEVQLHNTRNTKIANKL